MGGLRRRTAGPDVLVVCTGNVCRSPYAAAVLRSALPELSIGSAGTGALVGQAPTPQVLELLAARGVHDPQPAARALTRRHVRAASLVVTAERAHHVRVVRLDPAADDRTYTLRELARLLRRHPTSGGVDAVLAAARAARPADAVVEHEDDLADPYRGTDDAYNLMAADADAALAVLVAALRSRPC